MATVLGPTYGPDFTGIPRRIPANDYQLWLQYWPQLRPHVRRMWFDVQLGPGRPALPDSDPIMQSMWTQATQKRADCIVDTGKETWIIELHIPATANTIGRLLVYKYLWQLDDPLNLPIKLVLVTNFRDDDVAAVATAQAIDYVTLG